MPLPPLVDPPGRLRRLGARLLGSAVVVVLATTLFAFNGLQLLSLLVRIFSPRAFRAINRWGADTWWGGSIGAAAWGHGAGIALSGDELPPREHVLLIANHQQMADITFLMYLGRRQGRLGDMKWFVKDVLKWVPGVGWGMLFLDCLFVRRNWADDRASITRTFARLLAHRVPVWLVLFPEGTRVSEAKIGRDQQRASRHGTPPLEHLLLPRTRGFTASVQGLRSHLHAVYDVTIGYQGGVPTLWQYVQGFGRLAHLHVRRHPIDQLPDDGDALAAWLNARWREKDARLARFYATGCWDESGVTSGAAATQPAA